MNVSSVLWLVLLVLLAVPRAAQAGANDADDGCLRDNECRGHYEKAMKAYQGGRYEAALPEFQAAYGQRQMPWLLVNIGRTLHRLGRLEDAVQYSTNSENASLGPAPETPQKVQAYRTKAQAALDAMKASGGTSQFGNTATVPDTTSQPTPAPQPVDAPKPIYKKWWFWTIVGGVAAVTILGVGIGVGVSRSSSKDPIPSNAAMYMPTF